MLLDDKEKELGLLKNIINTMLLLTKQLKLYSAENQLISLATTRLVGFLDNYFLYHDELRLTVARHGFVSDGEFVERTNKAFQDFAYLLFQHGLSAVTFPRDLTPHDLLTFLNLAKRSPSESWEEGGFAAALRHQKIEAIKVREMAETDIAFINDIDIPDREVLLQEKSPMWDRFAFAVFKGLSSSKGSDDSDQDEVTPNLLARLTNKLLLQMSAQSKQNFSKKLSAFLSSIQQEKVPFYRAKALAKLTDFINRISPEIRLRLFSNIFNLKMQPDFADEFCSGLSDEIILEVLEKASTKSGYVPPVIMKVLGKIARDKKLDLGNIESLDQQIIEKKTDISKLFQKDDFEKYVPDEYRQTLLNIIQHDSIPQTADENLLFLKTTLEETQQERHAASIILRILNESPDQEHLKGLDHNLVNIVSLYLEDGDYEGLLNLWQACLGQDQRKEHFSQLSKMFETADVVNKIVEGITIHGKNKIPQIESIILAVGSFFVVPLLNRLATESNRTYRMHYLQILQKLDSQTVIAEATKLLNDERWYFVRNILYLLRHFQDKVVLSSLKPLTKHPHAKVRIEALRGCLKFGCKDSINSLLQLLDDQEPKTVDLGISLALMVRNRDVTQRLIGLLQDSSVFDYRFEQKKAIVKNLAETAPKEALTAFSIILTKTPLMHSKQQDKMKSEIIKTFDRFDPALLAPFIQEVLPKTSGETRSKLELLLRKVGA